MLISTGGSALLSHQIIIDGLRKFSELKEKMKDEDNNKINDTNTLNDINTINDLNDEIEDVTEKGKKK